MMNTIRLFFDRILQSTNVILYSRKYSAMLVVGSIIFFLIIRIGFLSHAYAVRDQLIQNDDCLGAIVKVTTLVEDPWMQSPSFKTYKKAIQRDAKLDTALASKRRSVLYNYTILWASIVAFLYRLTGIEFETIQWFLCFAGQIVVLIAFLRILRFLNFTRSDSALALVMYSLTFTHRQQAIWMPPREWSFALFLFIVGFVLAIGQQRFVKREIIVVVCLSTFGILMHPNFLLFTPVLCIFLFVQYITITDTRNDILKCGIAIGVPVVLVIVAERISSSYGFSFLAFSSDLSAGKNMNNISWSLFSYNFKHAVSAIKHIVNAMSIEVYDGLALAFVGLVSSYRSQKRLFLLSVCLVLVSFLSLFPYYHKAWPAEYFKMLTPIIGVVIVLLATRGLSFLVFKSEHNNMKHRVGENYPLKNIKHGD